MRIDPQRAARLQLLAQAEALCDRFDAAERDARKARAALLVARHNINRARLTSLIEVRRGKK
jgi:hypothetical protein